MRYHIPAILAFAVMTSVSCGKLQNDGELLFKLKTSLTKAEIITTSSLNTEGNSFLLDALLEIEGGKYDNGHSDPHYIESAEFIFDGSNWKGDNQCWCDGIWTNFWAVHPKTVSGRGGLQWNCTSPESITNDQEKKPYFTYDMSSYAGSGSAAVDTPDLLVAYARGIWNESEKTRGRIELDMQHVLSAIYFTMGHFDDNFKITEIEISGVQYAGTCHLEGKTESVKDVACASWEFAGGQTLDKSFSQTVEGTFSEDDPLLGTNYIFLIPQTMPDTAILKATIEKSGSDPFTKEVALSGYSWKPGYKYEYNLSYYKDKDELTVVTTEYSTTAGTWTD